MFRAIAKFFGLSDRRLRAPNVFDFYVAITTKKVVSLALQRRVLQEAQLETVEDDAWVPVWNSTWRRGSCCTW